MRKLLWFIGLGFLGVLAVSHWAGRYPARVVMINQGPSVRSVIISTAGGSVVLDRLSSGETRVVKVESGDYLTIEFDGVRHRRWRSPDRIEPAQSLILSLQDERVTIQRHGGSR